MALSKQPVPINFSKGVNTKTDPFQLSVGEFLSLQNTIFTKAGLLQKRNGYGALAALPDTTFSYATTFNGNLTAIGNKLAAYSSGSDTWVSKGTFQPVALDTLPLIRSNTNQSTCDTAISPSGLVCVAYTDQDPTNLSSSIYRYAILDSTTGQNVVAPTTLTATGAPRAFILGNQFIVVYPNGTALLFIAISISTLMAGSPVTISSTYTSGAPFDGVVANSALYVAWYFDTTPAIKLTFINMALSVQTAVTGATKDATVISVTADNTSSTPQIWVSFFDNVTSHKGWAFCRDVNLASLLGVTQIINSTHPAGSPVPLALNLTSAAKNGILTFFYQQRNTYTYATSVRSDYVVTNTLTLAGTLGSATIPLRSVGLGSKAFIVNGVTYFVVAYGSTAQPTYFISDSLGKLCLKLAYSNGGGYYGALLPSVSVSGDTASFSYLLKDFIAPINKSVNADTTSAIYSQTGINLASAAFSAAQLNSAEIGGNLNLSGGFLWGYDGSSPVEQGFNVWPDDVVAVGSSTSGTMIAQKYFYAATYEWSDNQGNIFRSAPSIPLAFTILTAPVSFTADLTSGSAIIINVSAMTNLQVGQHITGTGIPANTYILTIDSATQITMTHNASATNNGVTITPSTITSVDINVPTLRLTYKTANPVKIVLYRWGLDQQTFYQVTTITAPVLNDMNVDFVTITDSLASASILGNSILYTTGGVVENIGPPATSAVTLYKSRLFLIDAEDKNLLWYSKQVVEAAPVELSDLFTIFVAPTVSAQGSTGPMRCLAALDDKLIIFKKDAIYYITGTGPDNTGANNDFSEPIFITSTVGCSNQNSIAFIPQGLMFQSDKGIWLLGRDLSTQYIGAPVEAFNQYAVLSAITVPGTNQVRFTLSNGVTLMYDYFYGQWGTFVNIPSVTSTLFEGLHTFINSFGNVFQETPGAYLDGSSPTLISFSTGWLNLAGLQGYQRAYFFYLLGTFLSPHKLTVQVAYNYNPSPTQTTLITPDNYSGVYGADSLYGASTPYGGVPVLEQWKIDLQQQTCQSMQITVTESFDSFFGTTAGAGLTLSGINLLLGLKKSYVPIRSANTVG